MGQNQGQGLNWIKMKKKLSEFLQKCSSMGYGKTRKDVLKIAEAYASSKEVALHCHSW